VRERYLCFVSLPAGLEGWRRHAELHKAVVQGAQERTVAEGSVWGRWGAGVDDILAAGLHDGGEDVTARVRAELREAGAETAQVPEEVLEQMVSLSCVFRVNSFSFPGEDCRRNDLILPTICRANHSCLPNAEIVPGKTPGETKLVAIRPIAAGEPVEICYFPSDYLMRTTPQRRAALEQKFHFQCGCRRCEAPTDLTRRFAAGPTCCGCGGGGDFSVDKSSQLCCIACGKAMQDDALASRMLSEEAEVERLLESLEEPEDLSLPAADGLACLAPEALQRCRAFAEAHGRHRAAAEVARRRVPALHAEGHHVEAAAAQVAFVNAAKELLPPGASGLAWLVQLHARLAYVLELAGRRQEACGALREVMRHLEVASGQHPSPAAFFELMECPTWFRFLSEVGPELLS